MNDKTDVIDQDEPPENEALDDESPPAEIRSPKKRKHAKKLKNKKYLSELEALHIELVKLQQWVIHKGLKVCIVFEGRDGAGKGGAIKAITERVSPRVFRVVALPAPTEREQSQMYIQRYMRHFPAAGEIVIFDRSWYNRAGVERVMGFCTEEQTERFLELVPMTEKAMVDSGIILLKHIPYKKLPHKKVELPKRQKAGGYRQPDYPFKVIPQDY